MLPSIFSSPLPCAHAISATRKKQQTISEDEVQPSVHLDVMSYPTIIVEVEGSPITKHQYALIFDRTFYTNWCGQSHDSGNYPNAIHDLKASVVQVNLDSTMDIDFQHNQGTGPATGLYTEKGRRVQICTSLIWLYCRLVGLEKYASTPGPPSSGL